MTAIIAWSTYDGKAGAASLYLASDSRTTKPNADGGYDIDEDEFQKVFASPNTPDVFAICGQIEGVSALIPALFRSAERIRCKRSYCEGAGSIFCEDLFLDALSHNELGIKEGLTVFHGYRFHPRDFGLTKVKFNNRLEPIYTPIDLCPKGGMLARDGSGVVMVQKTQDEYSNTESEAKGYSRWFWMSFYASLLVCDERTCGGAPQLVGLYGKGVGHVLGVHFRGIAFVYGKPSRRDDIEYRDELFQRVNASGVRLHHAQPHARMGRPRIFNFAP